ncbi:hypothetical protein PIB30_012517 [Stylosanthes scabra]|uniref:Uncharacterized protein n=1 Tax=Stylosanthes scabra TaxID=79078 RepID=A0ABU6U4Y1_9FABA|nr:hypothetical protein [Stylosanthes scabra]
MMIGTFSREKEGRALPIWDCGSSLYDSYELVSLAYTIEKHMMLSPHLTEPNRMLYRPPEPRSTPKRGGSSMLATLNQLLVKGTLKKKKNRNKSNQQRKIMISTRKQNKLMKKCIPFYSNDSC